MAGKGQNSSVSVQIFGVKELDKLLNDLPKRMRNKMINRGLKVGGQILLAEVQRRAPVRAGPKGGKLKKNLKLKRLGSLGVQVSLPSRVKMGIPADSKWYYPAIVEYGHAHAAAIPFMRGSTNAKRDSVVNAVRAAIEAELTGSVGVTV